MWCFDLMSFRVIGHIYSCFLKNPPPYLFIYLYISVAVRNSNSLWFSTENVYLCFPFRIILYAIAMADYDQDNVELCQDVLQTKDGIDRLALYNSSVGR